VGIAARLLYSCCDRLVVTYIVFGVTWIPVGIAACRSGLTLSVAGYVGLDGFHIPGVASGRLRCGGGSRGDDGCTQAFGLSVDTEFSCVVRDSDFPLDWVAQKPRGSSPAGPDQLGLHRGWGLPVTAWPAC